MWIEGFPRLQQIAPVFDDAPPEFGEPVSFNDQGTANVSETVGNYLIEQYDIITEYETENNEEN